MRFTTLVLFVLLFHTSNSQTLTLDSFYTPGARWVEYTFYVYGLGESKIEGRAFWSDHDSVMNGKSYHLIYSNMLGGKQTIPVVTGTETDYFVDTLNFGLIGGIRVAGQQVFFYRTADSSAFNNMTGLPIDTETLVYDYGLQPGDSVTWQTYNASWGLYNVVKDTGSQLVASGYTGHTIKFDSDWVTTPNRNYWLSGIGSSLGFLGSHGNNTVWGFMATHTLCYTRGSFFYQFPTNLDTLLAASCFDMAFLGNVKNQSANTPISCYPNPLSGSDLQFIGSTLKSVSQLHITDMTGRNVLTLINPFKAGTEINLPHQIPGVYQLDLIFDDQHRETKKLVIE